MNFLKTTALGLVLCLGLLTHTPSATAATGEDVLLDATARRLNQQQLLQLQTGMRSARLTSAAEELNFVGNFLSDRKMVPSHVQETLDKFVSCQRLLMGDIEELKSRLEGTFKVLGIKGNSGLAAEVLSVIERGHSTADQTMSWMTALGGKSLIDRETLSLFRKFLGAEVMLADKSNPQQSFSNALAFLDVELEAASRRMTAEEFAGISLTMRTTHVRSPLVELTGRFLTLLEKKRMITGEEKETFETLLACQKHMSKSIEESAMALGVDSSDLERLFAEQPTRLLPVLKSKGFLSSDKAQQIATLFEEGNFDLSDAQAVIRKLKLSDLKRMSLFLEMLNPSAGGQFLSLAEEMEANFSQPILVKTNLLLNALIQQKVLGETEADAFKKLFAMQQALNKSTGHEGLKQAVTALGIAVEAPTPEKAATPSVLHHLRAQSASYSSFGSPRTPERNQSASRNRFGVSETPRTPMSVPVQKPSETLQQWAHHLLEHPAPVDMQLAEEHLENASSFATVLADLEEAAVQQRSEEERKSISTPVIQSPDVLTLADSQEGQRMEGEDDDSAVQSALSILALPAPASHEDRREDGSGALVLMAPPHEENQDLALPSVREREQGTVSGMLALAAPDSSAERREEQSAVLALMPSEGQSLTALALPPVDTTGTLSQLLALPVGTGGNIPSDK